MATKKPAPPKAAKSAKKAPAAKKAAPPKKIAKHVKKALAVKKTVTPKKAAVSEKKTGSAKPAVKSKITPAIKHKPVETQPMSKKHEPVKEVKTPKTSVKTSVPYHPEYKPMEQRQEAPVHNVPLVRYNDSELAEFRELIHKKLEGAKRELAYLQGLITRKDDMGGDESENRYMTMEDGSMSMEREQLSQMASRQITYIDHLEKALIRIENKTYGICRVTGKLIDKARLRAVPHATLSLEAKLGLVKPTTE